MSGRHICPTCGYVLCGEATVEESVEGRICSPLRCSEWRVVGKATKPNPITGGRTMLRLVESAAPSDAQTASSAAPSAPARERSG